MLARAIAINSHRNKLTGLEGQIFDASTNPPHSGQYVCRVEWGRARIDRSVKAELSLG